ncbi:hypothetical protein BH11VER1_BH11VER1_19050 [soil metagenome]
MMVLLIIPFLASCESTNQWLKAKPVGFSPFIEHQAAMKPARDRIPMHFIWRSPDEALRRRIMQKSEIYVAPVQLQFLRPLKKPLVQWEVEYGSIDRNEQKMATELRNAFTHTFLQAPAPHYRLTVIPNDRSVTLELAIIELNPTSPKGNAIKTAAKFFIGPFSMLGSYFTKGNIAIEGKVRNSATGELVFQFSDNESDRMTFFSLRDFKPYGHALQAAAEWASQFEIFTRTSPQHKIEETFCFTLDPR